jgi:hypothetical protein
MLLLALLCSRGLLPAQPADPSYSTDVTVGFHDRPPEHWAGAYRGYVYGEENLQNPLGNRTQEPRASYPNSTWGSGLTAAFPLRQLFTEARISDAFNDVHVTLILVDGTEVPIAQGVAYDATSSAGSLEHPVSQRLITAMRVSSNIQAARTSGANKGAHVVVSLARQPRYSYNGMASEPYWSVSVSPDRAEAGESVTATITYAPMPGKERWADSWLERSDILVDRYANEAGGTETLNVTLPTEPGTYATLSPPPRAGTYVNHSGQIVDFGEIRPAALRILAYAKCQESTEGVWAPVPEELREDQGRKVLAWCNSGKVKRDAMEYFIHESLGYFTRTVYSGGSNCPPPTPWVRMTSMGTRRGKFLRRGLYDYQNYDCDTPPPPSPPDEKDVIDGMSHPNVGESFMTGEIVVDAGRTVFIQGLPPAPATGEPAPQFEVMVGHRIVTRNTPRGRDLSGQLRLVSALGDFSGDAYTIEVAARDESGSFRYDESGDQVWAPYTVGQSVPVVERGHSGSGTHDWHSGFELFRFTMNRFHLFALTAEVDPDNEVPEGDGEPRKSVTIVCPQIMVDSDRDGTLSLQDGGANSGTRPFQFWSNDDDDGIYTDSIESEEDDLNVTDASDEDWRDNVIDTPRDLEDFARLHLYVGGLQDAFRNGSLHLGLKWADTNGTSPSIKLYRATSPADNDTAYLADGAAANRQSLEVAIIDARYPAYSGGNFQSDHTLIETGDFFVLPAEQALLLTEQNPTLRFIFEGCTTGKGQLKLVILKKEGTTYTEIGDGPGVWLDIKKPHEFIQRWTCGDGSLATVQPVQFDAAKSGTFAAPTKDEEKDLVLYVHGYNMQADWEKQRWIETTFKRLYWLGYKGRVGGFVWPCVLSGPSQFNASEERAFESGEQLKALLEQLKAQGYRVHVLGHSQGNVVVGEALRQAGPGSGLVSTYVASQSALAVHNYDASQPDRSGTIAFTPSTPNVYARYWTSAQDPNLPETWGSGSPSYFAPTYTQGAADKFVNFYNPQDYALTGNGVNPLASDGSQAGWLINQRLKPWIGYDYASYIGFRESPLTNLSPQLFRFPDDRFVIFSYGAQARSIALGAGASGGVFNGGNVNLFDSPTEYRGHHVFHSGQFRSNYAYRWAYWRQLTISCDLAGRNAP